MSLVVSVAVSAQVAEPALNVEIGGQLRPLARLVDGRWISQKLCAAADVDGGSSRNRLSGTGDLDLAPIRSVAPGTEEWLRLMPTIFRLFEQREREERISPDRTVAALRVVDWIFAAELAGGQMYYFEASRRVSNVTPDVALDVDPPGTLRVAVAGFLRQAGDTFTSLGTKSEMRWEQDGIPAGPPSADLTPLGVVADEEQPIWVMKGRSGARTWFTLFGVGQRGIRTLLNTRVDCQP